MHVLLLVHTGYIYIRLSSFCIVIAYFGVVHGAPAVLCTHESIAEPSYRAGGSIITLFLI